MICSGSSVHLQVNRMIVHSSSSESSSESDNDQTQDSAQSAAVFPGAKLNSIQAAADDARGSDDDDDDEAQCSVASEEGGALPRPAWMDAGSEDSSCIADARVQSIRDIIRVSDCPFM